MATEVLNTKAAPYSAIVSIRSTFADGTVTLGTGALVGKNDVLTATHVVYQPGRGGNAVSIQVTPGADFNGVTGVMESAPYGSFTGTINLSFPTETFSDGNNATTSLLEVPSDIALIGLTKAVGFDTGWYGLTPGRNLTQEWAVEVGYPGDGTGMMKGDTLAHSSNGLWIAAYAYDASTLLGAGSSGGPLYIQDGYLSSIIGVKSSGNSYVNYWADIDYKYDAIQAAMLANDNLIGGSKLTFGSTANDSFVGGGSSQLIDGLLGIDTVTYNAAISKYKILTTGNYQTNVIDVATVNRGDTLTNVERLKFADTNVALDVGPTQNAGSVYMLYKAAFNRAPDAGGMGYWLAQKDAGLNIVTNIAQSFLSTPEFIAKYGTNPSNATYIDKLYQNVLGRSGDAGGVAYWNQQLDSGIVSKAAALVAFATLPEGASNVVSLIANGIPYTEWVG